MSDFSIILNPIATPFSPGMIWSPSSTPSSTPLVTPHLAPIFVPFVTIIAPYQPTDVLVGNEGVGASRVVGEEVLTGMNDVGQRDVSVEEEVDESPALSRDVSPPPPPRPRFNFTPLPTSNAPMPIANWAAIPAAVILQPILPPPVQLPIWAPAPPTSTLPLVQQQCPPAPRPRHRRIGEGGFFHGPGGGSGGGGWGSGGGGGIMG